MSRRRGILIHLLVRVQVEIMEEASFKEEGDVDGQDAKVVTSKQMSRDFLVKNMVI